MASFGWLSNKYETDGVGTSAISNTKGDHGGASYGRFQYSVNAGSLQEYVNYLKNAMPEAYNNLVGKLNTASAGSKGAFGKAWLGLANDPNFQRAEEEYARKQYIDNSLPRLRDTELQGRIRNNPALQEVYFSTAVQHGGGGAAKIFNGLKSGLSDTEIINKVYDERSRRRGDGTLAWFPSSSRNIQENMAKNRFPNEKKDALAMLTNQGATEGVINSIPTSAQGLVSTQPAFPEQSIRQVQYNMSTLPRRTGFIPNTVVNDNLSRSLQNMVLSGHLSPDALLNSGLAGWRM